MPRDVIHLGLDSVVVMQYEAANAAHGCAVKGIKQTGPGLYVTYSGSSLLLEL